MPNFLSALALLVPFWLAIQFSWQSPPLSPAMLALLHSASSTSLALDLASKTSLLTFPRSNPYRNEEWLEVMLLTRRKVITNKPFTLVSVIYNMIFLQQCFVLPITKPIMLGSDFLGTHFVVLDIGDCTITLGCADYMLTTSLTHDPVYNQHFARIVAPATTEILYKQFMRGMQKNTSMYIAIVQH